MNDVRLDFESVQAIDVSRHFGRRRALSHLSLTARSGDIIGLLGPNGAGKSTLIAMLATLAAPSTGEVRYGTQTARTLGAALRARIGTCIPSSPRGRIWPSSRGCTASSLTALSMRPWRRRG